MTELEQAILEDPDAREPWLVYGDWLQSQGDPRGELLAAQAHRTGEVSRLLESHAEPFLGPFAPEQPLEPYVQLEWQYGFWRQLSVRWPYFEDDPESQGLVLPDLVRKLDDAARAGLSHPSARFLQSLRICLTDWVVEGEADRQDLVAHLASEVRPWLRELALLDEDTDDHIVTSDIELGSLQALWSALPHLRRLTLHAGSFDLGEIRAPALETLRLWSTVLPRAPLEQLAAASFPRLHTLDLGDLEPDDLAPLLQSRGLPRLRALRLAFERETGEFVRVLASSPLLARLEALHLEGAESFEATDEILRDPRPWKGLRWLHLGGELDPERVAQLRKQLPSLAVEQHEIWRMRAALRARAGLSEREALEHALCDRPSAEQPWEEYGRWLQSQGGPIEERLPFPAGHPIHQLALVTREGGLWRKLALVEGWSSQREELEGILLIQEARFLQVLTIESTVEEEDPIEMLGLIEVSPALRELSMGSLSETEDDSPWIGEQSQLWGLLPHLERLTLQGEGIELGRIVAPRLRSLALCSHSLELEPVERLSQALLPELRELTLRLGLVDDIPAMEGHLRLLLEGHGLPVLERLALQRVEFLDDLVGWLVKSPLLPRLRRVDLSEGDMTGRAVSTLVSHADRLQHLQRLDLRHHDLSRAAATQLQRAIPCVVTSRHPK